MIVNHYKTMNCKFLHPCRHGLSQVEVVVSSLIVGVVLVGALNVLGAAKQTNRVAADQIDAPSLAHQLMGEILSLPYEDPEEPGGSIGLETGETNTTRTDFDDIDDYNNWYRVSPQYKDGTPVPGVESWPRQVLIDYFDPATGNASGTDTGIKIIRVSIVEPGGTPFELQALRCKWGALQQPPAVNTTTVTSIDAQLQIGSTSEPALSSIHMKNHAHD